MLAFVSFSSIEVVLCIGIYNSNVTLWVENIDKNIINSVGNKITSTESDKLNQLNLAWWSLDNECSTLFCRQIDQQIKWIKRICFSWKFWLKLWLSWHSLPRYGIVLVRLMFHLYFVSGTMHSTCVRAVVNAISYLPKDNRENDCELVTIQWDCL